MQKKWLFLIFTLILINIWVWSSSLLKVHAESNNQTTIGVMPVSMAISNPKLLSKDIRVILKDKRFQYPDYFAWFKKIWAKIKAFQEQFKPAEPIQLSPSVIEWSKKILFGVVLFLPIPLVYFLGKLWSREKRMTFHSTAKEVLALPDQLRRKAETYWETGEYREAIRHLYLAGLLYLKKEKLIPESTAFSDSENLKNLRKNIGGESEIYQSFSALTRLFQEKWYGLKSCQSDDYLNANHFLNKMMAKSGGNHE